MADQESKSCEEAESGGKEEESGSKEATSGGQEASAQPSSAASPEQPTQAEDQPRPLETQAVNERLQDGEKEADDAAPREVVDFKLIFNKQRFDVSFPLDDTVATLKQHIQVLTGLPPAMQKVMFKGLAKEEKTLRELGISKAAKVMVVGSTLPDVLQVNTPSSAQGKDSTAAKVASTKEPLCQQKIHRKILDKGVPDDVMLGIKNVKDSLPSVPLSGMLNKGGGKVRLTFKLELDQLWIGTKERTDKIPMNSIKDVVSEKIEGHEEYHILGIQLGPTEASRYWVYWVPAQFVDAIKEAIFGKWPFF